MSLKHLVLALYGTFTFSLSCQINQTDKVKTEKPKEKQGIVIPISDESYETITGESLAKLIQKYGEKKIIDGETVYYWEINLMDFRENPDYNNSFKHVYKLHDNGGIDWEEIQIHFGKECQRIHGTLPNPPGLGVECASQDPCRELEEKIFKGGYCFFFQRGAVESGLMYGQGKEKRTDPSRTKLIP